MSSRNPEMLEGIEKLGALEEWSPRLNYETLMQRLIAVLLLPFIIVVSSQSVSSRKASGQISLEEIRSVIHREFGTMVHVDPSLLANFYLTGDFNGDGNLDLAVIVKPEKAGTDLSNYNVSFIGVDPYSSSNGRQIDPATKFSDHNKACLGVAIINGGAKGWAIPQAMGKYMFYECFSDFRTIRKGQKISRDRASTGPTPKPRGDSIQLDLENGSLTLLYWNGKTYRGFGQRAGD